MILPEYYGFDSELSSQPKLITITDALNLNDYVKGSKNDKLRTDIIDFLKSKGQYN